MSDLVRSMIPRTMSCFLLTGATASGTSSIMISPLISSMIPKKRLAPSMSPSIRRVVTILLSSPTESASPRTHGPAGTPISEKEGTRPSATMDARMAASEYSMSASWTGPKSTRRDPAGRRSLTASLITDAGPEKSSPTCIAWIVLLLNLMTLREPAMAVSLSFSIPSSSSAAERMLSENPCMPRVFVSALLILEGGVEASAEISGERALVNPL